MWPFLTSLVLDKGVFLSTVRAVVMALGGAVVYDPTIATQYNLPGWIGVALIGAGGFVRSSASAQADARKNGKQSTP